MTDHDDEGLFSPEQKKKLNELHAQRDALFEQIIQMLAVKYKYEQPLADDQRTKLTEEANELTENWDEADHDGKGTQLKSDLVFLLRQHHKIREEILDIQDSAIDGMSDND
jgi:hypothetical protein